MGRKRKRMKKEGKKMKLLLDSLVWYVKDLMPYTQTWSRTKWSSFDYDISILTETQITYMNAVKRNCGLLYMPSHAPKYIRISNAHEVKAEAVRELKNYLYIFTGLFMPFPLTHTHTHQNATGWFSACAHIPHSYFHCLTI